ncbi:MAG TPA: hypothetical protein VG496_16550 [Myxococcales bacterium]|nr:hypothetical protein [Myxococcales bacterium]
MKTVLRHHAFRRVIWLILSFAAPVSAAPTLSRYPADLRVEIAQNAEAARYVHETWGDPPGEPSVTFVGKQALEAYRALAARLFQPGASLRLGLEIGSVQARVKLESDGWHAIVEHDLIARDESGGVLGRWTVEGRGRVQGLGEQALPAAFERAAALAAQRFESQFETPPDLRSWLERKGVPVASVTRRPPGEEPPLPPPPPPVGPPRAPLIVYADAGLGLSPFSTQTVSGPASSVAPGFDARLGLAGRWAFGQLAFSWWNSRDNELEHGAKSIGLEAGPVLRLSNAVELGIGAGLHVMVSKVSVYTYYGPQPVWTQSVDLVPNALAALHLIPPIRSLRMRVTLEMRLRFVSNDSVAVVQGGSPIQFTDHLDSGSAYALLVGGELPLLGTGR